MPLLYAEYTLEPAKLPASDQKLRVRFDTHLVNGKNRLLMLYPNSDAGTQPRFARYAVGMKLQVGGVVGAQGEGQLVVTGRRLLGLFTGGSTASHHPLNGRGGAVFAFALNQDDIETNKSKTNWRGKEVEAVLASREDAQPWFILQVLVMVATVTNAGVARPCTMGDFLTRLTPEGRAALLTPASCLSSACRRPSGSGHRVGSRLEPVSASDENQGALDVRNFGGLRFTALRDCAGPRAGRLGGLPTSLAVFLGMRRSVALMPFKCH